MKVSNNVQCNLQIYHSAHLHEIGTLQNKMLVKNINHRLLIKTLSTVSILITVTDRLIKEL